MEDYQFEKVDKCPICGGDGPYLFHAQVNYIGETPPFGNIIRCSRCVDCGTIYHNPRLTRESSHDFYVNGLYRRISPYLSRAEQGRADRYVPLVDILELHPKRILDVGCSAGILLHQMQVYHECQVVGLEIAPMEKLIDEIVRTKEEVTGKFDMIFCIHMLEHTYDPHDELQWIVDRLEPGGTLFLELPVIDRLDSSTEKLPGFGIAHPYTFTREALKLIVNRTGLEYLYLPIAENTSILIIGDRYGKMQTEKVLISESFQTSIYDGMYH
jgi:SAM-dependent methyltransferase